MKLKAITLILVCVCCTAYAQKPADDLAAIGEKYKNTRMYYEVEYALSDQRDPVGRAFESQKISCYSWAPYTIYKYPGIEMYHNKRFKLAVYHQNKVLVVNKSFGKADEAGMQSQFNMDTILKMYDRIEVIKNEPDERTYRIYFRPGVKKYKYSEITFDPRTYLLTVIRSSYGQNIGEIFGKQTYETSKQQIVPRITIRFSQYRELSEDDKEKFDASHILTIDGAGKVKLADSYKKYKLSNYYAVK